MTRGNLTQAPTIAPTPACPTCPMWQRVSRVATARVGELETELARLRCIIERGAAVVEGAAFIQHGKGKA